MASPQRPGPAQGLPRSSALLGLYLGLAELRAGAWRCALCVLGLFYLTKEQARVQTHVLAFPVVVLKMDHGLASGPRTG